VVAVSALTSVQVKVAAALVEKAVGAKESRGHLFCPCTPGEEGPAAHTPPVNRGQVRGPTV
jgi:hypothetical protein